MSAVVLYTPPPAIARAWIERGYPSIQLEAHAENLARKARMNATIAEPPPPPPPVDPPPPCPATPLQAVVAATWGHALSLLIKIEVANEFGLSVHELLSWSRTRPIVEPRMAAMWMHRKVKPETSLPGIGRSFARLDGTPRDHTTVINAIKQVDARRRDRASYAERLDQIRGRIDAAIADSRRLIEEAAALAAKEALAKEAARTQPQRTQEAGPAGPSKPEETAIPADLTLISTPATGA